MLETLKEMKSILLFPAAFFTLWLGFLFVRKLLWIRLEKVFKRTSLEWAEVLLGALARPVRYLILFGALSISIQWAPPQIATHPMTRALCKIFIMTVLAWAADRTLTVLLFHTSALKGLSTTVKNLLKVVLRMSIYSIVVLIALESFGVSITPLLASLGVGSLAVALALQDTLGNLFSGFYLVLDRPVQVEDNIRLEDGTEGKVKNIGWRSTKIEMGSGNTVILPNSKLSSSRIINYEIPTPEVTFSVNLSLSIENDLNKIETTVLEVAKDCQKTVAGANPNFEPVFNFQEVTEFTVKLAIALRSKRFADQGKLKHEFIRRVVPRLKAEGIEIAPKRALTVMQMSKAES